MLLSTSGADDAGAAQLRHATIQNTQKPQEVRKQQPVTKGPSMFTPRRSKKLTDKQATWERRLEAEKMPAEPRLLTESSERDGLRVVPLESRFDGGVDWVEQENLRTFGAPAGMANVADGRYWLLVNHYARGLPAGRQQRFLVALSLDGSIETARRPFPKLAKSTAQRWLAEADRAVRVEQYADLVASREFLRRARAVPYGAIRRPGQMRKALAVTATRLEESPKTLATLPDEIEAMCALSRGWTDVSLVALGPNGVSAIRGDRKTFYRRVARPWSSHAELLAATQPQP